MEESIVSFQLLQHLRSGLLFVLSTGSFAAEPIKMKIGLDTNRGLRE